MLYQYRPADIQDFSGGMTDQYMNGAENAAEIMTNFIVLDNKSLRTRAGTVLDSTVDPQIPTGSQRIQTLINYSKNTMMFAHAGNKIFYRNPVNYASLLGPTGNDPFNLADANTHSAHTEWNRHLMITSESFNKPIKIYQDSAGLFKLRTAGLPDLTTSPSLAGTAGSGAFIYSFYYKYEYTVFNQDFVDFGPVKKVQILNINSPDVNQIDITSIPVLANASGDNYDTTNIKIVIARTINGGQESYVVGEVTNGTTTYTDTLSDTLLQDNATVYTSGGVPNNDPPPLSKYCHSVNGFTYYAHTKEGSQIFPSRIFQSQILDPDSVPQSFFDELEDEVTGLSSVQDIPIVGCRKHIYRIDGAFDEVGRGGMSHRRISDHAGCVSHDSFVQAEGGLFWWGVDGIYYTEGYKCIKVTDHLNDRYQNYIKTLSGKTRKIKGIYNEYDRTILWTFSTTAKGTNLEECDSIWVLDLNWGISDNMTSYIWSGATTFSPTSLVIYNGILHRADKTGYVLKFDTNVFTDPKIVAGVAVSTWFEESIIWTYKSIASNFGTSFARKIANKILISCKNETNMSMAITAVNDDGKLSRQLTPIRWRKNFTWGDEDFVWGNPEFSWYYGGTIELDRRFPAGGLRFNYLQLLITNDFTNILNSDLAGNVIVSGALNTATLVNAASGDWPTQAVDYFLYLEHDNYQRAYKVIQRSDDTITLEDVNNTLADGTWKFQLKGYKKNEIVNLLGYSVSWALTSRSYDTYNNGDSGGIST